MSCGKPEEPNIGPSGTLPVAPKVAHTLLADDRTVNDAAWAAVAASRSAQPVRRLIEPEDLRRLADVNGLEICATEAEVETVATRLDSDLINVANMARAERARVSAEERKKRLADIEKSAKRLLDLLGVRAIPHEADADRARWLAVFDSIPYVEGDAAPGPVWTDASVVGTAKIEAEKRKRAELRAFLEDVAADTASGAYLEAQVQSGIAPEDFAADTRATLDELNDDADARCAIGRAVRCNVAATAPVALTALADLAADAVARHRPPPGRRHSARAALLASVVRAHVAIFGRGPAIAHAVESKAAGTAWTGRSANWLLALLAEAAARLPARLPREPVLAAEGTRFLIDTCKHPASLAQDMEKERKRLESLKRRRIK